MEGDIKTGKDLIKLILEYGIDKEIAFDDDGMVKTLRKAENREDKIVLR